jgi:hypothetical protein
MMPSLLRLGKRSRPACLRDLPQRQTNTVRGRCHHTYDFTSTIIPSTSIHPHLHSETIETGQHSRQFHHASSFRPRSSSSSRLLHRASYPTPIVKVQKLTRNLQQSCRYPPASAVAARAPTTASRSSLNTRMTKPTCNTSCTRSFTATSKSAL